MVSRRRKPSLDEGSTGVSRTGPGYPSDSVRKVYSSLRRGLIEAHAVAGARRGLPGEFVPPANHHIDVQRLEFEHARRSLFSQAITVVSEPPNTSSTMSRDLLELRIARSTSATGFIFGCRSLCAGLLMNNTSPWLRAHASVVLATLAPAIEDRLELALVVSSAEGEGVLRPDDEGRPFPTGGAKRGPQPIQLGRRHRDIDRTLGHREYLFTRGSQEAFEVAAEVVVQDRPVLATLLVLRIVCLVDVVRRIGKDHVCQLGAEQRRDVFGTRRIAAEQLV